MRRALLFVGRVGVRVRVASARLLSAAPPLCPFAPSSTLPPGVPEERAQILRPGGILMPDKPGPLIYWMQASVREHYNHALEFAIHRANVTNVPLHVLYTLPYSQEGRSLRSVTFQLQGLDDVWTVLERERGVPLDLLLLDRDPVEAVASIVQSLNATMLVLDVAYMRRYRDWRDRICDCVPESVTVIQVESEVVVPLQIVSNEVAGSMKLIRPKIMERLHKFLIELPRQKLTVPPTPLPDTSCQRLQQTGVESWLNKLKDIDRSVTAADEVGGCSTAEKTLQLFTTCSGDQYPTDRNKPVNSGGSDLSPFLRFGHLSPVRVALVVSENIRSQGAVDSFLNEVIVRRELSHNFVFFNRYYDNYDDALPEFSKTTLRRHVKDQRYYIYTREQLEAALTHDVYWNAAQVELVCTGRIPNVMRMYWAKKFIEWIELPLRAWELCLEMNRKYALDGGGPLLYTGVSWVFGLYDQGFKERRIFGKLRYMIDRGLDRKFKMQTYVEKVAAILRSTGFPPSVEAAEKLALEQNSRLAAKNRFDLELHEILSKKQKRL